MPQNDFKQGLKNFTAMSSFFVKYSLTFPSFKNKLKFQPIEVLAGWGPSAGLCYVSGVYCIIKCVKLATLKHKNTVSANQYEMKI